MVTLHGRGGVLESRFPVRRQLASLVASGVLLFLVGSVGANATQYSPPWADAMWTYNIYSRPAMDIVKNALQSDYHSFSTNPANAKTAMGSSYAQSDAIWWMLGHGGVGFITTYNTTNDTTVINVSSQVPGSDCGHNNACLTDYTWSQMHDIRLMVFQGCHSGAQLSNGDSLPKRAYNNLGVDSSIGWLDLIYVGVSISDVWAHYFTSDAMILHKIVSDSAWDAAQEVYANNGSYYGYDNYNIYGGNTRIWPAQYGS
jgi:hypothetical protein